MNPRRWLSPMLLSATLLAPTLAAAGDPEAEAAFKLAKERHAIAEYAEAAALFEAAARKFPALPQAPDALAEAIGLRLGLGDVTRASQDAEAFDKLYGAKRPAQAAQLKLSIVASLMDKDAFSEARGRLDRVMKQVDQAGELVDRLEAHAWLGRSLAKLGDAKGAEREYGVVRALWKDPQAAVKQIEAEARSDGEAERSRRLRKALTAVGEAIFFSAEKKRAELDAIRYPEYRGAASKEQILTHVNTKVAEWVKKKRSALEAAERAYMEVLALAPEPPPRWVVASSARVGQMWGKFVAEFRAAPVPREWRSNGPVPGQAGLTYVEVRTAYYEQVDAASEPQKQQAKAAYKACLSYSAKYQYFDDYSRSCAVWLSKNYNLASLEELTPAPVGHAWSLQPSPVAEAAPASGPAGAPGATR